MNLYLVKFDHFNYTNQHERIEVESVDTDFIVTIQEILKDYKRVTNLRVFKIGVLVDEFSRIEIDS